MTELTKDLTLEEILAVEDTAGILKVPVPEWGGNVYVRKISGRECDTWNEVYQGEDTKDTNIRGSFVALCLVSAEGKRLAPLPEHAAQLACKGVAGLNRVWEAATKFNAMNADAVGTMEKNSEPTGSDGSGSS
jgi:hypothetical protein